MPRNSMSAKARSASKVRGTSKIIRQTVEKNKDCKMFDEEPAFVNVKLGATINTGDYESVRIDLGFTVPCCPKDKKDVMQKLLLNLKKELKQEIASIHQQIKIDKVMQNNSVIL